MDEKIKIGISTCLLGQNVRYDGGHKLDRFLRDTLGAYVEWVPVCPEAECGLSIPREAMRLVGDIDAPRLVTIRTKTDHTERMQKWMRSKLPELEREGLCGFVFKGGSPSSGMERVKVYPTHEAAPVKKGVGIFARAFMERFTDLPVEDDGRLHDPVLRENFVERIFVFKRWQDFLKDDASAKGLVRFHSEHKLLIMAHSPAALRELGALVAHQKEKKKTELFTTYLNVLMRALSLRATVKKNSNVLSHIMGYFKTVLSADEKQEILERIDSYQSGYSPLVVPLVLLQHYVRKYDEPYLAAQQYLHPHPTELMLRNHV